MALVKCHVCGSEVSSEAETCRKCGANPKLVKPEHTPVEVIGIKATAFLFIIAFIGQTLWPNHAPKSEPVESEQTSP